MSRYKDILSDLERTVEKMKADGVTVATLNDSLEELRRHSGNIEKVEDSIDAIKVEVIEPIKGELAENKQAAKYSRYGFLLGGAGLIATIAALYVTNDVAVDERLAVIEKHLNVPIEERDLVSNGIIEIRQYDSSDVEILNIRGQSISVDFSHVKSALDDKSLIAGLNFMLNEREIGFGKLPEFVTVVRRRTEENFYKYGPIGAIDVAVGDSIIIFEKFEFLVEEILSDEPHGRDFGDQKSAIYLRIKTEEQSDSEATSNSQ